MYEVEAIAGAYRYIVEWHGRIASCGYRATHGEATAAARDDLKIARLLLD